MKDRIKKIREEEGLKQYQIAKVLEVSASAVNLYESGKRPLKPAQITRLCEVYDINREWLENGTGPMHPIRNRKEELTYLFGKAMKEGNANRMALLSIGLSLTPQQVDLLAQKALELAAALQNQEKPES